MTEEEEFSKKMKEKRLAKEKGKEVNSIEENKDEEDNSFIFAYILGLFK